jgi:hypothetical protein
VRGEITVDHFAKLFRYKGHRFCRAVLSKPHQIVIYLRGSLGGHNGVVCPTSFEEQGNSLNTLLNRILDSSDGWNCTNPLRKQFLARFWLWQLSQ